jgi:hypothetical protein
MNTDRPTPETNAAQCEGLLKTNPIPMQVVTAEFARKLERERDEASELLAKSIVRGDLALEETKKAKDALHWSDIQDIREMQRERDKIQIELEMWRDGNIMHQIHRDELEKTERERDDARAVAGELSDVASKYLSFLLAVTPIKANETHEKETMKVIDALKRWKKL